MGSKKTLLTEELPGRTIRLKGEEHLYFSGTSYLGIARNEAFRHLLTEALDRYGTNYSSSRLSHRVLIFSFPYPTPQDEPITRIILNSLHTRQDLTRLTQLINDFESSRR